MSFDFRSFLAGEQARLNRDRVARGEPTLEELLRFTRDELDSPLAPAGFGVHSTHRPQTDAQMQAENPEGGRYCLDCCRVVEVKRGTAVHGMNPCDGPHTITLGGDDVLRRVPAGDGRG